ncbi:MAG: GMC family oxidoreductase [Candidatus Sericytochromatia bacterium]
MIFQGKNINNDITLETEVCIIGSGAGGGTLAKELAEKGINVVLLEEGGYHTPQDFNFRENTMIPKLFQESGGRNTKDMSIIITHGKGIGGSTVHNICLSFRPEKAMINRWRKEYNVSFTYEDLIPYFEKVEKDLEIKAVREDQINLNNDIFRKGCENLGLKAKIPNHNRNNNCAGCGFCELGCKLDSKNNVLKIYIPLASKNGAKIYADCKVNKILLDGNKVTGVVGEIINPDTKRKHRIVIKSKVVVSACGAINTPILMFKSGIESKSNLIGQSLHLHPYSPVVGFFDYDIYGWKGVPQSIYCDDFAEFKKDGYGGFIMIPGFAHPASSASLTPSHGKAHWEVMKDYKRTAAGGAMAHDETNGSVKMNRSGNPEITYWPQKSDQKIIIEGFKKTAEIYLAAGATKVLLPFTEPFYVKSAKEMEGLENTELKPRKITLMSVHPQGTCKMGEDPHNSVVNSNCEFHNIKGLFVCDTSVYPTSLGTPPQVPTMALGVMVAEKIFKDKVRLLS